MLYPISVAYPNRRQADSMIDVKHDDSILRTFVLFVQSAQSVLKYADATLYRKANLSVIKLIVLHLLAGRSGDMTPSMIAEWTQTERHNITTLVERMRRDGLVKSERNKEDKRFVNISLTDKGLEVLNKTKPVAWEIVHQVMLSISDGDALLLEKVLRVLRQNARDG